MQECSTGVYYGKFKFENIYITYNEFQILLRMHVCKCFVLMNPVFFLDDICLTHSNIPTGRQSRIPPQYDIVEIHTHSSHLDKEMWFKRTFENGQIIATLTF